MLLESINSHAYSMKPQVNSLCLYTNKLSKAWACGFSRTEHMQLMCSLQAKMFHMHPVHLSKNRVWTFPFYKHGPIGIKHFSNCCFYRIAISRISLGAQKSASWLSVMTYTCNLLSLAIWLMQQHRSDPLAKHPVLLVKCSIWSGYETRHDLTSWH